MLGGITHRTWQSSKSWTGKLPTQKQTLPVDLVVHLEQAIKQPLKKTNYTTF